ncbi:MAG: acyl-CoA dehydrogenase family protein [Pseudomonadota bacterium]
MGAAKELCHLANAANLRDAGQRVTSEASMAKVFATEACGRAVDRMLQIHGGYGSTRDDPIERLYRDARVFRIYEGTSEIQRLVIARQILQHHRGGHGHCPRFFKRMGLLPPLVA